MGYRADFPPPKRYRDLPHRDHNNISIRYRLLNAAWNALHDRGVEAISIRELADEAGVSQPAAYNHFRDKEALFAEVAREGLATLAAELVTLWPEETGVVKGTLKGICQIWLKFAAARPRHYALMFSLQFMDAEQYPGIKAHRDQLDELFGVVANLELGFKVPPVHGQMVLAILHGAGATVASGGANLPAAVVHSAISSYVATLRKKHR